MVKFAIIGSGSNANSYIFSNNDFSIVIDNGYSFKEFTRRCNYLNFELSKIKYLLLTHTHSDHKKGVPSLLKRLNIPLFYHEGLKEKNISSKPIEKKFNFKWDKKYRISTKFEFIPFKTFHDVPYSSGFYFIFEKYKFILITDTGKYNEKIFNYAKLSNIIFLEANYDPQLLKNGPYPENLKIRINSENGHLSNYQSLEFVNKMIKYYIDKSYNTCFEPKIKEDYKKIKNYKNIDKNKRTINIKNIDKNNKIVKNKTIIENNKIIKNNKIKKINGKEDNYLNQIYINTNKQKIIKKEIYLCHLSDVNNSPELIKNTFLNGLIQKYKNIENRINLKTNLYSEKYNNNFIQSVIGLTIENKFIKFDLFIIPKNELFFKTLN